MSGPTRDTGVRRAAIVAVVLALECGIAAATNGGVLPALTSATILLGVALAVTDPTMVAVLSFPATFLTLRLSAGALDLSYADAALVASVIASGLLAAWHEPAFRRIVIAGCAYLGLLAVAAALRPSTPALLEWAHRVVLVLGSAAVGAAISHRGRAHQALRAFVLSAVVVAVEAVRTTLANGLKPAFPFTFNKNAAGMLLTCALIVVFTAGSALRWRQAVTRAVAVPLLAGALACQSRMAVAAFVVVLLLAGIHQRRSTGLLSLLAIAASGAMVWATRRSLAETGDGAQFNSVNSRLSTYERVLDLWRQQRLAGAGLRFWHDRSLAAGEPHNLVIAALGETGVIGLAAVVLLNTMVLAALIRHRSALSRLAIYLLLVQIVDGLGDIYWRAGTGTLPWLVVGLALGASKLPSSDGTPLAPAGTATRLYAASSSAA